MGQTTTPQGGDLYWTTDHTLDSASPLRGGQKNIYYPSGHQRAVVRRTAKVLDYGIMKKTFAWSHWLKIKVETCTLSHYPAVLLDI